MSSPSLPDDAPLRIAWLVYRGNPHCGGQGVYTRYLARELTDLGHEVTVFSGPALPRARRPRQLVKVPGLDLYAEPHPFWPPWPWEIKSTIDLREFGIMCGAGFPEPYTFSLRARRLLQHRRADFDIVHDNQCLGTGLLTMMHDDGWPVLCTLHHPITVDRDLELAHATSAYRRFVLGRWYGFLKHADARRARRSRDSSPCRSRASATSSRRWTCRPTGSTSCRSASTRRSSGRFPTIARVPGRLMTTTSSDVPMKGLAPLLEALAKVRTERSDVELVIIGKPKSRSAIPALIEKLGLQRRGAVRVRRDHRAHRRALRRSRGRRRAVALRRLLAAGGRGDGVRRAARRHHGRSAPRSRGHRRRERLAGAARRPRRARRDAAPGVRRRRAASANRRSRSAARAREVHLARHRARHRRELPRAARRAGRRRG